MIFRRLKLGEINLMAFMLERLRHLEVALQGSELRRAKDLRLQFSKVVDESHRLLKMFNVEISDVWERIRPQHTIEDRPGRRSQVFDARKGLTFLVRYQPMELTNEVGADYGIIQFDTQEDADHFFLHDPNTAGSWHVVNRLDKPEN